MEKLNVIYEDNHIIVVQKIPNVPSQQDKTGDIDMLTLVKQYIKEKYKNNSEVSNRIDDYISKNYKYAMPINKFKMTTEIPLIDLKSNLEKFIIPESYYYLDNFTNLHKYIESNIEFTGEIVENNFKVIHEADICRKKY